MAIIYMGKYYILYNGGKLFSAFYGFCRSVIIYGGIDIVCFSYIVYRIDISTGNFIPEKLFLLRQMLEWVCYTI